MRADEAEARVNLAWFRGGWFDDLTLAWKDVEEGACYDRPAVTDGKPAPGATLFVPFALAPGAAKPLDVTVFTRKGCPHCSRAKARLQEAGIAKRHLVDPVCHEAVAPPLPPLPARR